MSFLLQPIPNKDRPPITHILWETSVKLFDESVGLTYLLRFQLSLLAKRYLLFLQSFHPAIAILV